MCARRVPATGSWPQLASRGVHLAAPASRGEATLATAARRNAARGNGGPPAGPPAASAPPACQPPGAGAVVTRLAGGVPAPGPAAVTSLARLAPVIPAGAPRPRP